MLQMKKKTNKMPGPGGRLRLGLARVNHLALFMQVAQYSTRHILGLPGFAGADRRQGKVEGGIMGF